MVQRAAPDPPNSDPPPSTGDPPANDPPADDPPTVGVPSATPSNKPATAPLVVNTGLTYCNVALAKIVIQIPCIA